MCSTRLTFSREIHDPRIRIIYHANRTTIDAEIEQDEVVAQELEAQATSKRPITL
jgi:hypothetical protein